MNSLEEVGTRVLAIKLVAIGWRVWQCYSGGVPDIIFRLEHIETRKQWESLEFNATKLTIKKAYGPGAVKKAKTLKEALDYLQLKVAYEMMKEVSK